ncbi:MAG: CRISPR-associated endonuclease Cas1 [Treponema sp.]|nr:CRISPR-associated endonuclease Cas1 [Treponema sp.]
MGLDDEPLNIPLDAVHQYAYCPRRAFLMYHDGRWADNVYTEDGRMEHRRVDEEDEMLPEPEKVGEDPSPTIIRSVTIGSETLRIVAKLDLVEAQNDEAIPVETKRGKVPENAEKSWPPERMQLMAQGLLLREAGYRSTRGVLYFARSRRRVNIEFDDELETATRACIAGALRVVVNDELPPPLVDDPKCKGCSLGGVCLPDETHALAILGRNLNGADGEAAIRRFYPARDDALPFYVQEQGAFIGKQGDGLQVTKGKATIGSARLIDTSQLVICGNITISAQAIHLCAEAAIPIVHLSMGNWFYGITQGFVLKNSFDRAAQFRVAASPEKCLALAKAFVSAKTQNQRTMLRRNARECPDEALSSMASGFATVEKVESLEALLGAEGSVAATYFAQFGKMLRPHEGIAGFDWLHRNRRPPQDPINSMLSFGYALLAKECTIALAAVGLDPYWGFYHQPRHGRPALALDIMEEFRPLIVDSAVITAINNGMVSPSDFEVGASGCLMSSRGRKAFIRSYEGRLEQLATHPIFDYRCSWRRIIAMQSQLLARHLRGEIENYQGITTR